MTKEEQEAAALAATGSVSPDGGTVTTTSSTATTSDEEAAAPSKKEWAQYRQEQRRTNEALTALLAQRPTPHATPTAPTPKPTTPSADAPAEWQTVRLRQDFDDALDETDVSLSKGQRRFLRDSFIAQRPPDAKAWITSAVASIGVTKTDPATTSAPGTKTTPAATAPSDTGPPAGGKGLALPAHPSQLTQQVIDAMTPQEAREYIDRYMHANGKFENPFAAKVIALRRAPDVSGLVNALKAAAAGQAR